MVGAIVVGLVIWPGHQAVHALQSTTPALTGWVTSVPEGRMEGVPVSARREGSNITVTVVSDAAGVYSFPRDRLEPGEYTIGVRAAGYVLRPSTRVVEVTGEAPSVKDLHLGEATLLEKGLQLSSAEWLWSYPLPEETTFVALRDCARCHNQQRVAMSRFNEEQLRYVMQRMSYYWLGSTAVDLPDTTDPGGRLGKGRRSNGAPAPLPSMTCSPKPFQRSISVTVLGNIP